MEDKASVFAKPDHAERVAAISQRMKSRPKGVLVTTRKPEKGHNSRSIAYKKGQYGIDVGNLRNILEINKGEKWIAAEGLVTMGDIVKEASNYNLVPTSIPEFSDFTVAGLACGGGVQTTAHKHGLFRDSVLEMEVVLGSGDAVRCSATENPALFVEVLGSQGTMGIVTAVKLRLMDALPFVRCEYHHYSCLSDFVANLNTYIGRPTFLDAMVFSKSQYTIVTGEFVDEPCSLPIYHALDPEHQGLEWYYQHARASRDRCLVQDVIPTPEYVFRSMRGLWWVADYMINFKPLTETYWGRRFVDKSAAENLRKYGFTDSAFTVEERERCVVNQDLGIELERLAEGIQYVQDNLNIYPLWACVIDLHAYGDFDEIRSLGSRGNVPSRYIVDIGIYGEPKIPKYQNHLQMRLLQNFVHHPSVWGVCYLSKEEMRRVVYDREKYEKLRNFYHAEGVFMDVEDKVRFIDGHALDLGPIPHWRIVKSWRQNRRGFILTWTALLFIAVVFCVFAFRLSRCVFNCAW